MREPDLRSSLETPAFPQMLLIKPLVIWLIMQRMRS